MAVFCPKHRTELKIENVSLIVLQRNYSAVIGTCPHCNVKYINRRIFKSGNSFSVNGINYEFHEKLSREFPFDPSEEERRRLEEEEKRKKEEDAKRRAAVEQKRLEKKRKLEEQKNKEKEEKAEVLYASFVEKPSRPFHPIFVYKCDEIPKLCPFDQKELLYLTNVYRHGYTSKQGFCCPYCSRLFVKKQKLTSAGQTNIKQVNDKQNVCVKEKKPAARTALLTRPSGTLQLPAFFDKAPKTAILIARIALENYGEIGAVAIVAKEQYQNTKAGIYWVGRTLPSILLAAIQTNEQGQFEYKGLNYRVVSYKDFYLTKKYLDIVARFCNPVSPQTVYVFAQKNIEHFQSENYETVTAMVPCAKMPYPVPVTVYYDKDAHRYYLNEITYDLTREKFGLPYLKLRSATEHTNFKGFAGLKQQSILFRLGYSVSSNSNLTMLSRRKLLGEIIDSGILTKAEVMTHLEWLINTRYGMDHMDNAVGEWKADLIYISNYRVKEQRTIWVETFKSKYSMFNKPR